MKNSQPIPLISSTRLNVLCCTLLLLILSGHKLLAAEITPKQATAQPSLAELRQEAIRKKASETLDNKTQHSLGLQTRQLQEQDNAIYNELRDEEELSTADIGMLWEAAVERSGTIRYAIEKLSRKDATGQPVGKDNFSKKIVNNLIHLSGVAGSMWTGTPAGLIGSNLVQNIVTDNTDPSLNFVTDADMVILAKEVEKLQSQVIDGYYHYRHAKEQLKVSGDALQTLSKQYSTLTLPDRQSAFLPLLDSVYTNLKASHKQIEGEFEASKVALSLLVGADALAALEKTES
jgi:hypothetical protein